MKCSIVKNVLILVLFVFINVSANEDDDLEVILRLGRLKGHRLTTRKGREFLAFQGIPYAKPPVGELRFKQSVAGEAWTGVRDASIESSSCPQLHNIQKIYVGNEDCLYLNVYTPKVKPSEPLAVMFWIHGGGWYGGSSSSSMYGANYLLDKDVILVTINYRLGPLGFLSTGDSVVPGNNGHKDQVLALEWVRDNIEQFGGNPGKVTIFGQSAGGASVHYHTLSPLSKGLFHGVIAHSGTSIAPWAIHSHDQALARAMKLGTLLGCTTTSSQVLVDCLMKKDAKEIIDTFPKFMEWNNDPPIPFPAVVESGEDAFLIDTPMNLLQDPTRVADVPFITGITSGEGGLTAASIFNNPKLLQELNDEFGRIAPISMCYRETSPDPDYVSQRIREYYFADQPITNESLFTVVDMYTDSYFLLSADETVRLQSTAIKSPVFYYYFDYKPPVSYTRIFGDGTRDYGVSHSDELQFLFPHGQIFPDGKLTEKDFKVVDILVTLWTDFARTGNPTPPGHVLEHWNPVKTAEVEYLHITREGELSMHHSLLAERAHFWASLPLTNHPYTSIRDEL